MLSPSDRLLVELEGIEDGAGGVLDPGLVDGHRDLDFRGRDHADVDASGSLDACPHDLGKQRRGCEIVIVETRPINCPHL